MGLVDNVIVLFICYGRGCLLMVEGGCVNNGRGIEMGSKGRRPFSWDNRIRMWSIIGVWVAECNSILFVY